MVEAALKKADIQLKCFKSVMDLDSTEAIKSAVEAGLGIGFVSVWAIFKELELGALMPTPWELVPLGIFPSSYAPDRDHKGLRAHSPGSYSSA